MKNSEERQLAIFEIGSIFCALPVEHIQEIKNHLTITPVYNAPQYVSGIANLRGQVITILNLRRIFALESMNYDSNRRIMVVNSQGEPVGLLIDKMMDIVYAKKKEIQPTPSNIDRKVSSYFLGIYMMDEKLLALLDLDKILNPETRINKMDYPI